MQEETQPQPEATETQNDTARAESFVVLKEDAEGTGTPVNNQVDSEKETKEVAHIPSMFIKVSLASVARRIESLTKIAEDQVLMHMVYTDVIFPKMQETLKGDLPERSRILETQEYKNQLAKVAAHVPDYFICMDQIARLKTLEADDDGMITLEIKDLALFEID